MTTEPSTTTREPAHRQVISRLAYPALLIGLALCAAGYGYVGLVLLRALLARL